MVRKWAERGGGGEKECYHNSTVPVKEYLEVIDEKGDPSLRSGQVGGQEGENRKVKMENRN